jgi:large subunit ribosomal protein L9
MRLLLLTDVGKLGHVGDIVEVSAGYGRNCLLPQRLAVEPTEENIKAIEEEKKRAAAERAKRFKEYERLAAAMQDVSVTIEAAANPEGTLYGSVGPRDIAEALHALGHPVRPEQVVLDAPIRTLDNRIVKLKFTDEIMAELTLWVVREGAVEHGDEAGERSESEPESSAEPAAGTTDDE